MTNECSVTPDISRDRAIYGSLSDEELDAFDQPAYERFQVSLAEQNSGFLRWYEENYEQIGNQQQDEALRLAPMPLLHAQDIGE